MTTTEKVRAYILAHPDDGNVEVAAQTDTTADYAAQCRTQLRKEKLIPPADPDYRRKKQTPFASTYHTLPRGEGPEEKAEEDISGRLRAIFKRKDVHTFEELSNHFDCGIGKIKAAVEDLHRQGVNFKIEGNQVLFSNIVEKSEPQVLQAKKGKDGFYRFGVTGDNHLCSKYERLDVLNALYDRFLEEGIDTVYNTGNWIDGEARFNKHDLLAHGLDNQIRYFIKNYPQRDGITTHYITGDDHEGWYTQREGIDVGRYAEEKARAAGRNDLRFLGHMEADVILPAPNGQTVLRVLHPGGGSAYAISYTSQKIVESYTGGEKPDILLLGHYHKAAYDFIRGVNAVQTGCTMDQSPFMRKKRLAAHLGGWIIEFSTDDQGAVTRFKQEWIPFFDTKYYEQKWKYKW